MIFKCSFWSVHLKWTMHHQLQGKTSCQVRQSDGSFPIPLPLSNKQTNKHIFQVFEWKYRTKLKAKWSWSGCSFYSSLSCSIITWKNKTKQKNPTNLHLCFAKVGQQGAVAPTRKQHIQPLIFQQPFTWRSAIKTPFCFHKIRQLHWQCHRWGFCARL